MPEEPTRVADRQEAVTNDDRLGSLIEELQDQGRRAATATSAGTEAATVSAVLIRCSMGEGAAERSLWPVEPAWETAVVPTLGGVTWETDEERLVVSGEVASALHGADPRAVLVVGHTACSVVATAHEQVRAPGRELPAGIAARLAPLVSLVEDAANAGLIDDTTQPRLARDRLVEYLVVRQVRFLAERLPGSVTVAGYVDDQDGAYGSFPGRHYLVALDGNTGPGTIRSLLPPGADVRVGSLLW